MSRGKRNDVDCARCLKVQPGTGDTWGIPTDDGTLVIHAMCMVWNEDAEIVERAHSLCKRTTRMHSKWMRTARSSSRARPRPDPSSSPLGVGLETYKACWDTRPRPARHAGIPPSPCGQTDTCKNITFTNFVCGR